MSKCLPSLSPENGNKSSFWNVIFLFVYERTDNIQTASNLTHTLKNSKRVLMHKTKLSLHYIQTVLKTGLYTCNICNMTLKYILVGTPTCHHNSFLYSVLYFTSQLSFLCLHTNPHTDPDNSNLTTTARHSLAPSIPIYFHQPYGPFQGPSKRGYIQRAKPTSSAN